MYNRFMTDEGNSSGVSVHAGFPNPATDASLGGLDLNKLLVRHGVSTYFFRIEGEQWQDAGVFDGDVAIVDRALSPQSTDVVLWWNDPKGEFSVSNYKKMAREATVWGVITSTIHQFRKTII